MKRPLLICIAVLGLLLGGVMLLSPRVRRAIGKRLRMGPDPILVAPPKKAEKAILFLHHSTGNRVWNGGVQQWLQANNRKRGTSYRIAEQAFPKREAYGWNNYPYDYWNIWVNHQGAAPYQREPTLEMICKYFDAVVLKHCYPVSRIHGDMNAPDVASPEKRMENYTLQYQALKAKMHEYPSTQFILWTGAALVRGATDESQALRARAFFEWVKSDWDEPGDNIFLWDFYELETEGSLYMQEGYGSGPGNSHPNPEFCKTVAPLLAQRIIDVLEGRGDSTSLRGDR